MKAPSPCNPYHAKIGERRLFRGRDGKSQFKVYYVSIVGRENPERTEWDKCGITPDAYEAMLADCPTVEGVGFITAFPHITKVFRFGPEAETVLNVKAWKTSDMSELSLARSDGYVEFACLAEAAIAAEEYELWAAAESVETYLTQWSTYADGPVNSHDKLQSYWT